MQLTDCEKKILERLTKQHQFLVRWRWVELIGALAYIGAGGFCLAVALFFLSIPSGNSVLIVASLLPIVFGLVALGVRSMASLMRRWNGNPETLSSLRSIEDLQHDG